MLTEEEVIARNTLMKDHDTSKDIIKAAQCLLDLPTDFLGQGHQAQVPDINTSPDLGICEAIDIPPVPSSNKITAQAVIIDQTEPAPIKCRKSKFKIPHITKHNLHKGSGRTNNQILNDILRIIDRYIVPLDQKFMIEEILQYSTEMPELRESGLPWMKEDFKIQKTKTYGIL